MTFTVEDETGLEDANAYITIEEFEAYWDDRGYDSSGVTDPNKRIAIIKATDYIENRFRTMFKGIPEFEIQALSFPRLNLYDNAGRLVSGLPVRLKSATAEYAKRALTSDLVSDPTVDATGFNVTRKRTKVGPIEKETEYANAGNPTTFKPYPSADKLLQEYIVLSGGRTVRA